MVIGRSRAAAAIIVLVQRFDKHHLRHVIVFKITSPRTPRYRDQATRRSARKMNVANGPVGERDRMI